MSYSVISDKFIREYSEPRIQFVDGGCVVEYAYSDELYMPLAYGIAAYEEAPDAIEEFCDECGINLTSIDLVDGWDALYDLLEHYGC